MLVQHCYKCHSEAAEDLGGELLLDSRDNALSGGESGPAVVPKNIEESLIISAIEYRDFEMPPDGKLSDEVIADFREWIRMGAPDPREIDSDETPTEPAEKEKGISETPRSLKQVASPGARPATDGGRNLPADTGATNGLETKRASAGQTRSARKRIRPHCECRPRRSSGGPSWSSASCRPAVGSAAEFLGKLADSFGRFAFPCRR